MTFVDPLLTANMTPEQRGWFFAEYDQASRDEIVGVLLALFLGSFGLHHFYLRRNGLGVLYLLFSWTGVPGLLGFIEAFFMPGRVRRYNAQQAAWIASQIAGQTSAHGVILYPPTPAWSQPAGPTVPCPSCGAACTIGSAFCSHCGATLAQQA